MNTFTIIMSIIVWVIVVAAAIRGSRLERKLRQERRDLFTATGLLWALADRTEPKTLYHQQDES